jgi:hypothetical protein
LGDGRENKELAMSNPSARKTSSRQNRTGMTLIVLACILALLALVADLVWMMPRQPATLRPMAKPAQEQITPASYYALQFSFPTNESGSPAPR